MILAGDIGGTKTILALFSRTGGAHMPVVEATFPSSGYTSLEAIIREFLAANPAAVESACFGVAGPVVAGRASITNLPWVIDAAAIRAPWASAPSSCSTTWSRSLTPCASLRATISPRSTRARRWWAGRWA